MALVPTVEICVLLALSVSAWGVGLWLGCHLERARPRLLVISLLAALGYAWTFSGRLGWAALLPLATVMLGSNLMPILLSFTAGLASRSERISSWCRPLAVGTLLLLAFGYTILPLARPWIAPLHVDGTTRWKDEICLQSHPASCAPAAAATLLHIHGIRVTERSLATACFTSRHGTEPLGLFRGLSAASRGTAVTPAIASAQPQRWADQGQFPNIALVRFESVGRPQSLDRLLGPRGEGHAVVVLGRTTDANWILADPAFGKTIWTDQQFRQRFTGDAIYLVRQ